MLRPILLGMLLVAGAVSPGMAQAPVLQPQPPVIEAPATSSAASSAAPAAPAPTAAPTAAPEERSFNVGVLDNAPPFSSIGRFGARTGFDVDVALALCERLAADCTVLPFAAEDIAPALRDGRVDYAVASLSPTDRIDDSIGFTDPYLRVAVRFVRPASGARSDLPAAALAGSAQAEELRRLVEDRPVRLYANAEEMWVDLAFGRLGAVLAPAIAARRDFLSTPIGQGFRFAAPANGENLARIAAIAVRRGDGVLTADLNRALADLLAAPEYAEILSRHLDIDLAGAPRRAS